MLGKKRFFKKNIWIISIFSIVILMFVVALTTAQIDDVVPINSQFTVIEKKINEVDSYITNNLEIQMINDQNIYLTLSNHHDFLVLRDQLYENEIVMKELLKLLEEKNIELTQITMISNEQKEQMYEQMDLLYNQIKSDLRINNNLRDQVNERLK